MHSLSREGPLSCHTCSDTGTLFTRSHSKDHPHKVLLAANQGHWGPTLNPGPRGTRELLSDGGRGCIGLHTFTNQYQNYSEEYNTEKTRFIFTTLTQSTNYCVNRSHTAIFYDSLAVRENRALMIKISVKRILLRSARLRGGCPHFNHALD